MEDSIKKNEGGQYNKDDNILESSDNLCCICYNKNLTLFLNCNHVICLECITNIKKLCCPLCRTDLSYLPKKIVNIINGDGTGTGTGTSNNYLSLLHNVRPLSLLINPSLSLINPSLSLINPSLSSINPSLSSINPSLSSINPSLSLINPSLSTINPSLSSINPSLSSINPSLSSMSYLNNFNITDLHLDNDLSLYEQYFNEQAFFDIDDVIHYGFIDGYSGYDGRYIGYFDRADSDDGDGDRADGADGDDTDSANSTDSDRYGDIQ